MNLRNVYTWSLKEKSSYLNIKYCWILIYRYQFDILDIKKIVIWTKFEKFLSILNNKLPPKKLISLFILISRKILKKYTM